ncbi:MAG: carbon-nitrogen hydrolase family protein [Woeseiaceae bacterium]
MNAAGKTVNVAALQMCSGDDVARNLDVVDDLLDEAVREDCQLVVLPENVAFVGRNDRDKLAHAEVEGDGPIQQRLKESAKHHALWIIAGSLPLASGNEDRCFGASMVFDPHGQLRGCYRKIHLFDVDLPDRDERYRESASMMHGDDMVVVDTAAGRTGLSICYDVRFPELYRCLSKRGATVLTVPAAFTSVTGAAHWQVLLRARAIENLAYVIAPGQHGQHPNGRQTYGHSMIIDPWGRVLGERAAGDGLVVATLETDLPERLRRDFPVLQHRRIGIQQDQDIERKL